MSRGDRGCAGGAVRALPFNIRSARYSKIEEKGYRFVRVTNEEVNMDITILLNRIKDLGI
ncbi:MAG: hypothetical protein AB2L13_09700 [Spirochaetota bacterium]